MAKKGAGGGTVAESPVVDLVEAQQNFLQYFGCAARPVYDLYPTVSMLTKKLGMLFNEVNISEKTRAFAELIWAQRFFVGETNAFGLRMSPIFVFCVYDNFNMRRKISYPLQMKSNKYSLHPVFRVQKCTNLGLDARGCCAIFIDELGRVYEDWQDFTKNNKFDDCVMLTPRSGIYMGDPRHGDVMLEVFLRKSGVTEVLDVGSTILGFGAAGLSMAAAIPAVTLAPVVVGGATVVGLSCAVYTGIRSTFNLYDRGKHQQSIGVKDREARAAWINIATGTLLAATSGATQVIGKMVEKGKNVSRAAQVAVRGTQLGTFGMQTAGCVDGLYTITRKMMDGEDFSLLEVAQLGTALFMWTHSARNLGFAENFVKISGEKNTMATKRFLVTTHKTMLNTLVDHRTMMNYAREMDGAAIVRNIRATLSFAQPNPNETVYDLSVGVDATVKIEYCRLFDTRIETIVHKLDIHYKHNRLSALKQQLIKFMCSVYNMTLKGIENLVEYAHKVSVDFVRKIGKEFECFDFVLKLVFDRIKQHMRTKMTPMSANDYMNGLNNDDRRVRQLNEDIREHVLREMEAHSRTGPPQVEAQEDATTEANVTEARKVTSLIEDRADEFMELFQHFDDTDDRKMELKETITGILRVLTPRSAEKFFDIAFCLISTHVENIKRTLQRSIPVDNLINTIFCLLDMRSEHRIETVLARYTETIFGTISGEFATIFQPITKLENRINCKKCSGKRHVPRK